MHLSAFVNAQKVNLLLKGKSSDPSFYDICKWSEYQYLIAGESGTFLLIDTNGKTSNTSFSFPNEYHLLRLVEYKKSILIGATNGIIGVIDKKNNSLTTYQSIKTKNLSNYNLLVIDSNQIISCGGSSKIAKGKPTFPKGFIASYKLNDSNLITEQKICWKRFNSFVWCFLEVPDKNQIYAVAYFFPANRSLILKSIDKGQNWEKAGYIKGLVHQISMIDGELYYAGCKNALYFKHGLIGKFNDPEKRYIIPESGCIYDIEKYNDNIIGCSYRGAFIIVEKNKEPVVLSNHNRFPQYELVNDNSGKIYSIGHGGSIFIIEK